MGPAGLPGPAGESEKEKRKSYLQLCAGLQLADLIPFGKIDVGLTGEI